MKSSIRQGAIAVVILCFSAAFAAPPQQAVVDPEEIAEALAAPQTRGLTRGIGVRQKGKVDLNIPFDVNSSELLPEARRQLEYLAEALARDSLSSFRFRIAGHTDASGSADYNRELSEKRAEAVMQFLVEHGVNPERLVAIGYGEDRPLPGNDPGHAGNRRVEVTNIGSANAN